MLFFHLIATLCLSSDSLLVVFPPVICVCQLQEAVFSADGDPKWLANVEASVTT